MADAYASLRERVVGAGVLRRSYAYYASRTALSFAMLLVGIALAFASPVLGAMMIAFGSVQVTLIGHDAGHMGVFTSRRANTVLGALCWTLAVGISFQYWIDRHNRHHATPNHVELDPDLQWNFGPLLTPFLALTFRFEGWCFAIQRLRGGRRVRELALLFTSTIAWLLPITVLGPSWLATYLASQVLASLYLAAVVAPNHIGMPVWSGEASPSFLHRQLLSSRNVSPSPLANFFFGGLNYQIEHHLFASMARNRFAAARTLVRAFCAEQGLPYAEEGTLAVYRTVLSELPRAGRLELT